MCRAWQKANVGCCTVKIITNCQIKNMDLEKFYKEKYVSHWAEGLEIGDKCLATIRHKTDGSKNLHNVEVIVIENNKEKKEIVGWFPEVKATIPYNELKKLAL